MLEISLERNYTHATALVCMDAAAPPPPPPASVPVAAAAAVADDEAGAWELLKRRVAENRKLSTENRKLRNDLGEARVSTQRSRSQSDRRAHAACASHLAQRVAQDTDQQLQDALAQNSQLQKELTEVRALHVSRTFLFLP